MLNSLLLLGETDLGQVDPDGIAAMLASLGMGIGLVFLAISLILIISGWKIFTKAGKPGWASLIPIYNVIVLLEMIGKPVWWVILLMIPCIGQVVHIFVAIDLAKSFGKGMGFGLGLAFLPFIFGPVLGFGGDRYLGPVNQEA